MRAGQENETRIRLPRVLFAAILAVGLAVASVPGPSGIGVAWGQASADGKAAADVIARAYGVRVLKVRPVTHDGRAAFEVTVMNPRGDFNEAFQVTRLLVDATTGKLISGFGHGVSAHRFSAPSPGESGTVGEDVGPAARRMSMGK